MSDPIRYTVAAISNGRFRIWDFELLQTYEIESCKELEELEWNPKNRKIKAANLNKNLLLYKEGLLHSRTTL